MSRIERGQFSSLLRRYLGMTGASDVVDELAPEVGAGLTLETERPEWEFLKGAKIMSAVAIVPASVGLSSAARLRNPAGTNVVGIIVPIIVSGEAAAAQAIRFRYTVGNDAGDLGGQQFQSNARDTRYPRVAFPGNSALRCSGDYGQNGDSIEEWSAVNSVVRSIDYPLVLTPGFQIQITTISTNIGLQASFHWLEKRLDPLEQS